MNRYRANQHNPMLSKHFDLFTLCASETAEAQGWHNLPEAEVIENLRALCTHILDPLVDQLTLVGQVLARRPQIHPLKLIIDLLGLLRVLLSQLSDQPGQLAAAGVDKAMPQQAATKSPAATVSADHFRATPARRATRSRPRMPRKSACARP